MDNPTPPDAEKLDELLQGVWNTAQWTEKNRSGEEYFAWKDAHLAEAKRRLQSLQDGARKETVLRLSDWAVSHDLTRGSNNRVTFDVDEWNAIREKVAQLSHPVPATKSDKE